MFPPKKPGMGAMLGIAKKAPREEPPPAYSGANAPPDPDAAMEGAEGGEGMCPTTCPSCGASYQLQITPVPDAGAPEEAAEPMPDMEAAG